MNSSFADGLAEAALLTLKALNDPHSGMDPDKARAAALVLKEGVNLCRVEVERMNVTGDDDSSLMPKRHALHEAKVTALPTAHNPYPTTTHRLRG